MAELLIIRDPATPKFVYVSGTDGHPVPSAVREVLKGSTYRGDFLKDRQPPAWRIPAAALHHLARHLEADGWSVDYQEHGATSRASTGPLECPHPDCRRPRARGSHFCPHCGHQGDPVSLHAGQPGNEPAKPCPSCDMPTIPGVPHCPDCQAVRPTSARYCRDCGQRLCRTGWDQQSLPAVSGTSPAET